MVTTPGSQRDKIVPDDKVLSGVSKETSLVACNAPLPWRRNVGEVAVSGHGLSLTSAEESCTLNVSRE
jgi:hypothetical protein